MNFESKLKVIVFFLIYKQKKNTLNFNIYLIQLKEIDPQRFDSDVEPTNGNSFGNIYIFYFAIIKKKHIFNSYMKFFFSTSRFKKSFRKRSNRTIFESYK